MQSDNDNSSSENDAMWNSIRKRERDGEMYNLEWCRRRKPVNTSLPHLLEKRELGLRPPGTEFIHGSRELYHCIAPRHSLSNVEKPNVFVRRFTPDGKRLICFNLTTVFVYDYLGVEKGQRATATTAFDSIFRKKSVIGVLSSDEAQAASLCREFCFVTNDSKHLIIMKSKLSEDGIGLHSSLSDFYRNNESLPLTTTFIDYALMTINLNTGTICDERKVKCDRLITLNSIHLVERTLALLSMHHQTINFFQIDESSGAIIQVAEIGHYMYEDDALHLVNYDRLGISPMLEKYFTGFKQRLLTFIYKRMKAEGKVKLFLQHRAFFDVLKMAKIQMLGSHLVLIRLVPAITLMQRPGDHGTQSAHYLFVILEWRRGEIHNVYGRSSKELFDLYEEHNELFKNGDILDNYFPTSIEHCQSARVAHQRTVSSLTASRGDAETRRRMLYVLPNPSQQHPITTPYFDPTMFSFDEKLPGVVSKIQDVSLKFFSRRTNRLAFELNLEGFRPPAVVALFHPVDPFVICFDKNQIDGTLTFHIPNSIPAPELSSKHIELHVALIGMASSGKSALAVKYITRRFIGEYHSELEDTYCHQDTILSQKCAVWVMDTVDGSGRDSQRYLGWSDLFVVVYDVTSQLSLQYAEKLLHQIAQHEHSLCMRSHKTLLVGNKCDLERYRQVRESDGERLAKRFGALFAETSAVEDYQRIAAVIQRPLSQIITERTTRRSPSPRLYNSDSEVQTQRGNKGFSALKNVARSGTLRRSKSPKSLEPQPKFSITTKSRAGSKLLKLFHN